MSDFAPVDGRGVWGATDASTRGIASALRGRVVEVAPGEARPERSARRITDEVELSAEAISALARPVREDVVARARERIAAGYYDQQGVIERTIDRAARDLVG
jgi:hypothetical protein